jgi:hypothetical protein
VEREYLQAHQTNTSLKAQFRARSRAVEQARADLVIEEQVPVLDLLGIQIRCLIPCQRRASVAAAVRTLGAQVRQRQDEADALALRVRPGCWSGCCSRF